MKKILFNCKYISTNYVDFSFKINKILDLSVDKQQQIERR